MIVPHTTTKRTTYSNPENGVEAIVWNTDSGTHPFRVVFRDTDAGQTVGVKDFRTLEHADRDAQSFVA